MARNVVSIYIFQSVLFLLLISLPVFPFDADIPQQRSVNIISEAEFIMSELAYPPEESALWKPVMLTHYWHPEDYKLGRNGWYRIAVNLSDAPKEQLGIYIRRYNMNAAIFVNNTFLKDGGSFEEPLSRNWNRPLYTSVPSLMWKKGKNYIYIRLKSYPQYALISPVAIGPTNILHSEYELQTFLQTGLGTILFPMVLALAIFMLGLWVRRRSDIQYLWFSLALFAWSSYSLNMIIIDPWVSTKAWEWFAHSCIEWWSILLAIFAHRFISRPHLLLEKIYVAFGVFASLTYFVLELEDIAIATYLFHGLSIFIGLITTCILFVSAKKSSKTSHLLIAFGYLLLLLSAINDWLFQTSFSGVTGRLTMHLHHYTAPLLFFFMAWHLSGRFITALKATELLNTELENRVEEARKELEHSFQEASDLQKSQTISLERERLSREIHDGMSGNIANSIMLTELLSSQLQADDLYENKHQNNSSYQEKITQLQRQLREGLTEIRNLMLTMEGDVSTLDDLSSHIKDKYQQGLHPQTVLKAHFDLINGQDTVSYKIGLNILRMTQEILNNINKHANATEVTITIKQSDNLLHLAIKDNGCGFGTDDEKKGHYGLNNLHKRCENINGKITIKSAEKGVDSDKPAGCTIELQIPL